MTNYNADNCIVNYLDTAHKDRLLNLRRELFREFCLQPGRDLDYEDKNKIEYIEAYKRYTGLHSQIYRQISASSWDKLKQISALDLVIVSALYGLLRYNEQIRWYDTTMNDKVQGQKLKTWWKNQNLSAILNNYVEQNNISEVHIVLSNDYNEALGRCFLNLKAKFCYHNFANYKSGSNAYRGKWVEDFIQTF